MSIQSIAINRTKTNSPNDANVNMHRIGLDRNRGRNDSAYCKS